MAIYSVLSNSESSETIFAFRDCFVDEIVTDGPYSTQTTLFRLNSLALDREQFRLAQELVLTQLSEGRLDPDYVSNLILKPLDVAITSAEVSVVYGQHFYDFAKKRCEVGLAPITDVLNAEFMLSERKGTLLKAKLGKEQRMLELETQRSRLEAEKVDLKRRMDLLDLARVAHEYKARRAMRVTVHTFAGAFVEEGDPICTIEWDS